MRNSKLLIGVISILLVLMVACTSSQPAQNTQPSGGQPAGNGNSVQVAIKDYKFSPADITVSSGTTVTWTNEDSAPHTVESSDKMLKSDELSQGDKYSYTFMKAGKVNYICGIHPSMKGSVTVQ